MKLQPAIVFALSLALAAGRVVPAFSGSYTVTNITTLIKIFGVPLSTGARVTDTESSPLPIFNTPAVASEPTPLPSPATHTEWEKYVCRGEKLNQACKLSKDKAADFVEPIDSPWDGTLEAELQLWGYKELPADSHCSFDDIAPALKALKIGLLSKAEGGYNYCYQVRHVVDDARDAQGEPIEPKDQTYNVNGKEYRMTGAYSIIGANPRSGAIFIVDIKSAAHAAEDLWDPKVPTADTLPALRSISDLSWGFWNRVAKGKRLTKINYFVVHNIVNQETDQLIEQSLSLYDVPEGQQRVEQLPKWPGLEFDAETDAGQAMLGSRNGIAAAYFLLQHKTQLGGNKYIYQVSLFASEYEGGQPSIIFHVKDVQVSVSNSGKILPRRELALSNDTSPLSLVNPGPASGGDSPPPPKRPKPNPPSPDNPSPPNPPQVAADSAWATYVCRGEKLTQASKLNKDKAQQFLAPIDTPWVGDLQAERKLWGYTLYDYADCDFEGEYYDVTRAYRALKILPGSEYESEPEDFNDCFRVSHYIPDQKDDQGNYIGARQQTYMVDNKVYRITGAHGTFGINVEEGIIWFIDVASAPLKAASLWKVPNPPIDQLPALRQMSDLAWGFWHEAHSGSNLGHITKFIVPQIINEATLSLIKEALETYTVPDGQERLTAVPTWPGVTFDIETEQGKALLGSPNGIAAAYFLAQHKSQLGTNKYVHQLTVFEPDDDTESESYEPTLVFYVKDAPALSSEDAISAEESTEKMALTRRDDKDFWTKYVCRGEKLTQASLRNKDTAIQFANPIDSEWDGTLEEELKLWGYTDFKGKSLYCDVNNIAESLNSIGIDAKFKSKKGENQCFNIGHRRQSETVVVTDQTYKVGDKVYRMTDAYSHIGVNARDGVITFLNVRSAERSAQLTWRVATPAADDLPKLRQISDLAWAFWKREHKDGKGLDNINKFLVHDIINRDTEKLIMQALSSYKVPEGGQRYKFVPKWPGLVFGIESDEGKAMLGSPNGMAAGYFLAQHKTQLGGNKYVYQATVWKDRDGDLQMIFWVKTAPPPSGNIDGDKTSMSLSGGVDTINEVVKRSADGKNVIRRHVVCARL